MTAPAAVTRADEAAGSDSRDPLGRLLRLLDDGSLTPLDSEDATDNAGAGAGAGARTVAGRIAGSPVIAYCTDASVMGGAIGGEAARRIASAIDRAVRERRPVVGLWHSGGARLAEGVRSLDGIGRIFAAMIRASGRVPQLSVVLGPAAGGAAYGLALGDLVIMAPAARVFVTGPDVVRSVTGERVDMEALGGPETHDRRSGVVHMVADSEADAFARARHLTRLLAAPGRLDRRLIGPTSDIAALLPESPRHAYDVRPLARALLDGRELAELQARWAPNLVTGLGRLAGRTVGVVANNPLRKAGCLDSLGAEKAARFVRMCDAFGVPLVVLVDVPGYLPGARQEWEGVVRRGAKLLYAFGEARVPRVTLITRKAYGGAFIAMNSRALGANAVFAWPGAEVAVMGPEAAVRILHRRELGAAADHERDALLARLADEHKWTAGGVERAMELDLVDSVIDPATTRRCIADALLVLPHRTRSSSRPTEPPGLVPPEASGTHGNIPL